MADLAWAVLTGSQMATCRGTGRLRHIEYGVWRPPKEPGKRMGAAVTGCAASPEVHGQHRTCADSLPSHLLSPYFAACDS